MNKVTGGSDYRSGLVDVSPDTIQHFVNFYGGGAWSFGDRVANFAVENAQGESVERRQVPFAGRFMDEITPYPDQQKFYNRLDELAQYDAEFKNLPADHARQFYLENRERIALYPHAKTVESALRELRAQKEVVEASNQLSEEEKRNRIEAIETRMKSQVDRFNRDYNHMDQ